MVDQQHVEARAVDAVDGERRAVERDRALRRDEFGEVARRLQREAHSLALVLARHDLGHAVDMARHDVAAELVADLQRALQIDARAGLPAGSGGKPQRLFPGLDLEPALIGAALRQRDDGEANAGAGDRRADRNGLRIVGRVDPDPRALVERPD